MKATEELVALDQRGCEMNKFYAVLMVLVVVMIATLGLYASNLDYKRRILCLEQGSQIISFGEGITWYCLSNNHPKENNE